MVGIFVMLSNYFHDLAVALLASNVFAVYYVGRFLDESRERSPVPAHVFRKLARITYVALGYILVGGLVRAFFFMEYEWNSAVGRGQVSALVVKHVLLFAITAFGVLAHTRYLKRYGAHE